MDIKSICVYCASSTQIDELYFQEARKLGRLLAQQGITLINGAGSMGLMAACTGSSLFLFETKGYGRVAYAKNGLVFLKSNDSVLVSIDRKEIKRTYYKDYKKLMEEAKKQFPGATLSDEKKTRYNVD